MSHRQLVLRIAPLAAAAWLAVSAAPAQAGLFDDDVARKQIFDLQKRLDAANARQDQLAARLTAVDEAQKAPNQPVLELANQLQALREEMRDLRGQIEVLTNTVEGNAKRQRDMYVDIDSRLRKFEGASAPPAANQGSGAPSAAVPATGNVVASAQPTAPAGGNAPGALDEKSAYEAAQNLRRNGNYQAAIAAFQQFIAQYPKSSLANRAQYWIGDSYYNLHDYRNAIASQQKLVATYPDSPSVPDALLNMASAQAELGETRAARNTMTGLVSRYPSSEAAAKAKSRLSTLR